MRRAAETTAVVIAIAVLAWTTYTWGRDLVRDFVVQERGFR